MTERVARLHYLLNRFGDHEAVARVHNIFFPHLPPGPIPRFTEKIRELRADTKSWRGIDDLEKLLDYYSLIELATISGFLTGVGEEKAAATFLHPPFVQTLVPMAAQRYPLALAYGRRLRGELTEPGVMDSTEAIPCFHTCLEIGRRLAGDLNVAYLLGTMRADPDREDSPPARALEVLSNPAAIVSLMLSEPEELDEIWNEVLACLRGLFALRENYAALDDLFLQLPPFPPLQEAVWQHHRQWLEPLQEYGFRRFFASATRNMIRWSSGKANEEAILRELDGRFDRLAHAKFSRQEATEMESV